LPSWSYHRSGNRRRGTSRHLYPFGRATDSHQLRNAQEMTRAAAGRLISESELTAEKLTGEFSLFSTSPRRSKK